MVNIIISEAYEANYYIYIMSIYAIETLSDVHSILIYALLYVCTWWKLCMHYYILNSHIYVWYSHIYNMSGGYY